jgi:hypothetical protein
MPRSRKDSKELRDKWLECYIKNRCLLLTTCEEMNVSAERIEKDWIIYPDFIEAKRNAEKLFAERVESRLIDTAIDTKPNTIAQIFYLKHNTDKYNESMQDNRQLLQVENIWFNKSKDTKQLPIHTDKDTTTVIEANVSQDNNVV